MTYLAQKLMEAQVQAQVKAVEQGVFGAKDKVVARDDEYFQQVFMVTDKENN